MEYGELIKGFSEKIGLADLAADESGTVSLDIDGMLVSIIGMPVVDKVIMMGDVGDIPPEGREKFYRTVLEAMYLDQGSAGCTFSIEADSGKLKIHRSESCKLLDVESFSELVESFVNVLEEWRRLAVDFRPVVEASEKELSEEPIAFGNGSFMQV